MPISADNILGTGEIKIPSGINATTPEQKQMYRAALEFERFFVSHLMKQMDAGTKALAAGSGEEDNAASIGAYQDMVRDQMTQSVLDGGGLGLASIIYNQVSGVGSSTYVPPAATPAPAPTTPSPTPAPAPATQPVTGGKA